MLCDLDIPVILPEGDVLQLDEYVGRGLQPGETELPNDEAGAYASLYVAITNM